MWNLLIDFNNNNPTGLNDWYIPSSDELNICKNYFSSSAYVISSTEVNDICYSGLSGSDGIIKLLSKNQASNDGVVIRSF